MEEEEEKGMSEEASDDEVPSEEIYEESSPKQDNPNHSLTRLSDDEEMEWNVEDADESSVEEEPAKGDESSSGVAIKDSMNGVKEKDSMNGVEAKDSTSGNDATQLGETIKTKESGIAKGLSTTTEKESISHTTAQSENSELLEIGKDGKLFKSKPKLNLMDLFNKAKEKKVTASNEKTEIQEEPESETPDDSLFEKEDEETVDENDYEEQQPTAEDYARYKAMMQESSNARTRFDT